MKITYSNKKTEKICENFSKAINELGKDVATKLVDLLNAIRAFPTLYDIYCFPQYRMHPLKANRKYQYSLKQFRTIAFHFRHMKTTFHQAR